MSPTTGDRPTARELGQASMTAVEAGDREAWLALFSDDAVVEDPVGPSMFDPDGTGHHGREAIAAFYDNVIGVNESIRFTIRETYLCGEEVANVGTIRINFATGGAVEVDGVYCYRVSTDGKLGGIRAYWEADRIRSVG
ncbi:MAG TPA: nuclear transport factor 2 family protein [Acidimicrobiales bacterium]